MHFKNNCWLAKITQVHISSKNGVYHLQKLIVQGLPTSTSQDNNSYRWWRMQFYEVLFRFWVIAEFYYSAATSAANLVKCIIFNWNANKLLYTEFCRELTHFQA